MGSVTVESCPATTAPAARVPTRRGSSHDRCPRGTAGRRPSRARTASGWSGRYRARRPPRCTGAPAAITRSNPARRMWWPGRPRNTARWPTADTGTPPAGPPEVAGVRRRAAGSGGRAATRLARAGARFPAHARPVRAGQRRSTTPWDVDSAALVVDSPVGSLEGRLAHPGSRLARPSGGIGFPERRLARPGGRLAGGLPPPRWAAAWPGARELHGAGSFDRSRAPGQRFAVGSRRASVGRPMPWDQCSGGPACQVLVSVRLSCTCLVLCAREHTEQMARRW
jgi:hypothetical protein